MEEEEEEDDDDDEPPSPPASLSEVEPWRSSFGTLVLVTVVVIASSSLVPRVSISTDGGGRGGGPSDP